jgi:hypothetical protein
MPTRRPWDLLVQCCLFVLGFLGCFSALLLITAIVVTSSGREPSHDWGLVMVTVGFLASLGFGGFLAFVAPRWSAALTARKPKAPAPTNSRATDVDPIVVAQRLDHGPAGTAFLELPFRVTVMAVNRSWSSLGMVAFFAGFLWLWYGSLPSIAAHPIQAMVFGIFPLLIVVPATCRALFGGTEIEIDLHEVRIREGWGPMVTTAAMERSHLRRLAIRRIQRGKRTITQLVLEDSNGSPLATIGEDLPWPRLCHLHQVLDELVVQGGRPSVPAAVENPPH